MKSIVIKTVKQTRCSLIRFLIVPKKSQSQELRKKIWLDSWDIFQKNTMIFTKNFDIHAHAYTAFSHTNSSIHRWHHSLQFIIFKSTFQFDYCIANSNFMISETTVDNHIYKMMTTTTKNSGCKLKFLFIFHIVTGHIYENWEHENLN